MLAHERLAPDGNVARFDDGTPMVPGQRLRPVSIAEEPFDAPVTVAPAETGPEAAEQLGGAWLRRFGFQVEIATAVTAGVGAALLVAPSVVPILMFAVVWTVATYHRGRGVTSPLARQLATVLRSAVLPAAMSACMVEFASFPTHVIPQSLAFAAGAAGVASFWRLTRWGLQAPVRVVVVGDRIAVSQAIARWQPKARVAVVGGIIVEPDLAPEDVPAEIMGVTIRHSLSDATTLVASEAADLVVVSPGPGFTSIDFRRLGWALQDTGVEYGVMGVLDAVAAHRIVPGGLGGATLMDVRAPKPSTLVRAVKAAGDRLVAAVLAVVLLPVIAVLMLAIRLDSRGPALFRQTRVGQFGRQFTVYKLRTMVDGAERMKSGLVSDNVDDQVLFKMRRDPRITRVGRFLRSTSLDELPQVFNVLLGSMSLVGPRPFLPAETAAMERDALRRLAVKPGITGLWQVSGRSDLSFREAADLDTYYADNWSLSGDLRICLSTVRAVLSRRGAY